VATFDPAGKLRQLLDVNKRELLTTQQIVERYPNFPSIDAVRSFVRRWRVPVTKVGRSVLIDPRDLLAVAQRLKKSA
jgi:hypothetical protein